MHGTKRNLFIFFFVFICCSFLILPQKVNAETHVYNGTLELKMITGNYQDGVQDGVAVSPEWITGNFPSSNYLIVPGASDLNYNGYWFVKYFNLYFDSDTTFDVGKTYAIDIDFSYGSYITWSNYFGWPNMIADRTLNFCASGSSQGDLSQCSVMWNPTNDSTSSRMTLLFRPNTTSTHLGISVGSLQNGRFVFWNRLGDPQGFRISSVNITSTQNSGGSVQQDFSAVIEEQKKTTKAVEDNTQAIEDMHDDIMSDDITDSEDTAESFFDDFQANNHGLSSIITAPLRLINSLLSSTCTSLTFPLPFVNQNVTLPCMSVIYNTYFHDFLVIYQLITTGLIGYWVVIKIYGHVKGMQNPNDDKIEVFDL